MVMYNIEAMKDPRDKRLAKEHELIDELCGRSVKISYEIVKQDPGFPPEGYKIIYDNVKSIVGVRRDGSPVYGMHHEVEIIFPPAYPGAEGDPKCRMLTDIWHPNIRSKDPAKGRICINSKALGAWHTLDMLSLRIGHMLQYKNYHALNVKPWPEDAEVAKWVRDYAEPKGIVNKDQGVFVDESELLGPEKPGGGDNGGGQENADNDDDMWFQRKKQVAGAITMTDDDLDMSFSSKKQPVESVGELDFDFQVRKR